MSHALDRDGISQALMRGPFLRAFQGGVAPGSPEFDFIFTVCDSAAGETCPVWIGHPMTAHWGIEDPAAVEGTDIEKERAFAEAFRFMRNRIGAFVALPMKSLDQMALQKKLGEIGGMEGASGEKV